MKFRIRHMDKVVGVFIIASLAFLIFVLVTLGANQRWFAKNYLYESRFSSANGIAPGTPIFMKGFQIGRIVSTRLNDANTVDVTLEIFDPYAG